MASTLTSFAASLALGAERDMIIPLCSQWVIPHDIEDLEEDVNVICVLEIDVEHCRQPIIGYLKHEKLHSDPRHGTEIQ